MKKQYLHLLRTMFTCLLLSGTINAREVIEDPIIDQKSAPPIIRAQVQRSFDSLIEDIEQINNDLQEIQREKTEILSTDGNLLINFWRINVVQYDEYKLAKKIKQIQRDARHLPREDASIIMGKVEKIKQSIPSQK